MPLPRLGFASSGWKPGILLGLFLKSGRHPDRELPSVPLPGTEMAAHPSGSLAGAQIQGSLRDPGWVRGQTCLSVTSSLRLPTQRARRPHLPSSPSSPTNARLVLSPPVIEWSSSPPPFFPPGFLLQPPKGGGLVEGGLPFEVSAEVSRIP